MPVVLLPLLVSVDCLCRATGRFPCPAVFVDGSLPVSLTEQKGNLIQIKWRVVWALAPEASSQSYYPWSCTWGDLLKIFFLLLLKLLALPDSRWHRKCKDLSPDCFATCLWRTLTHPDVPESSNEAGFSLVLSSSGIAVGTGYQCIS